MEEEEVSIVSIFINIVKTKIEEEEVVLWFYLCKTFNSDPHHCCQLLLAYDEFHAKYPDGEINKEQFMEVSKVQFCDDDKTITKIIIGMLRLMMTITITITMMMTITITAARMLMMKMTMMMRVDIAGRIPSWVSVPSLWRRQQWRSQLLWVCTGDNDDDSDHDDDFDNDDDDGDDDDSDYDDYCYFDYNDDGDHEFDNKDGNGNADDSDYDNYWDLDGDSDFDDD